MASPQKENGYVAIANELVEQFAKLRLSKSATACLWVVVRKTYGYNKKEDKISLSQFVENTGLTRMSVTRGVNELVKRRVLKRTQGGFINAYKLNKNYDEWTSNRIVTSNGSVTRTSNDIVTKTSNGIVTHKRHKDSKDNSEEKSSPIKKNMSFKKYKEPEIDIDSGDYIPEEKKVRSQAVKVFKIFKEVLNIYPLNWNVNKTQRASADNLSTERSMEQIRNALKFYKENKDEKYCPAIRSPFDLDSKWDKLTNFKKKQ